MAISISSDDNGSSPLPASSQRSSAIPPAAVFVFLAAVLLVLNAAPPAGVAPDFEAPRSVAAAGALAQEDPQEFGLDIRVQGTVLELNNQPASGPHLIEIRQDRGQGSKFIRKRVELLLPPTGVVDHTFRGVKGVDITRQVDVHVLPLPYPGAPRNSAQMYLSDAEGRRMIHGAPLSQDQTTVQLGDYAVDFGSRAMQPAELAMNVTCFGVGGSACEIFPVDGSIHGEIARLNYPEGGLQLASGVATPIFGWPDKRQVSFFGVSGNKGVLPKVTVAKKGTAIASAQAHHSLDVSPAGGVWGTTGAAILIPVSE